MITRSATTLVDELIGTAYPTVKVVAQNIASVKKLAAKADSLDTIGTNLSLINSVYNKLDNLTLLSTNYAKLETLANSIDIISNVNDNIDQIVNAITSTEASKNLAQAWAENPYNSPITVGHYSALHWATLGQTYAVTASTKADEASADASAVAADKSEITTLKNATQTIYDNAVILKNYLDTLSDEFDTKITTMSDFYDGGQTALIQTVNARDAALSAKTAAQTANTDAQEALTTITGHVASAEASATHASEQAAATDADLTAVQALAAQVTADKGYVNDTKILVETVYNNAVSLENTISGYLVDINAMIDNINLVANNITTINELVNNIDTIALLEGNVDALVAVGNNIAEVLAAPGYANTALINAGIATTMAEQTLATKDEAVSAKDATLAAKANVDTTYAAMNTALGNVTDYSNTLAQLNPAAKEIVSAADIVDFFIYDTTKDSDGGAWRKRCNWTSWFKEGSGGARGTRNQAPQKWLIVTRSGATAPVTIYDLDQASCPMWMVFNIATNGIVRLTAARSVTALNGCLYIGTPDNADGLVEVDFLLDRAIKRRTTATAGAGNEVAVYPAGIASRNASTSGGIVALGSTGAIVNAIVNDVAATVLPGTPIDRVRKLPTPTVAVATAGGVSVIHWDGVVVSNTVSLSDSHLVFFTDSHLWAVRSTYNRNIVRVPFSELRIAAFGTIVGNTIWSVPEANLWNTAQVGCRRSGPDIAYGGGSGFGFTQPGLALYRYRPFFGQTAVITSKYNTGYLPYDTKLALAESTADLTSLVQGATNFDAGSELLTPGSWSMSTAGGTATATESPSGQLNLTGDNTNQARGDQSFTTVVGKTYRLTYTVGSNAAALAVGTTAGGANLLNKTFISPGTYTDTFVATTTTAWVRFYKLSAALATVTAISCKERVTTVLYDELRTDANADNVPDNWNASGGSAYLVDASGWTVTSSGSFNAGGWRAISGLTVGVRYTFTQEMVPGIGVRLIVYAGTGVGGAQVADSQTVASTSGKVSVSFVATSATMTIRMSNPGNSGSVTWTKARLDVAAADRSVAGNHPLVYGTVTRTAVATGAELAAYGGFSASNYLETGPLAITLGTADFMFAAWAYYGAIGPSIPQETLFAIQGANEFQLEKQSGSTAIRVSQTSRFIGTSSAGSLVPNAWNHVVFVRSASTGTGYYYINGVLAGTTTMPSYDGTLTNGTIRIGNRADGISPHRQQLALPRVSATAPTPQQIRDMYEAEKALFQPNAKCLLPADSINALSYDDTTDLLHVATTNGMARLKDLLVLDKDAIVVTGIEAKSGIIVTRDTNSADAQLPSLLMREEILQPNNQNLYNRNNIKVSGVTTNATPTVITRLPMDKGEKGLWTIRAKANQYADGAAYAAYARHVDAYRPEEGNIALRGSAVTIGTDIESTSTMDISITANTTTQTLDVTATGIAATNLEWEVEATRS